VQQVPTGLEWGPDGALYVSTLTGFPFVTGLARVYRMEDLDGDGDAMEDGETTIYAEGLTTATSLAFDTDGSLLVTEFSSNLLEGAPGRLVRVVGGEISVVAEPLISPTGITVFDGQIIVAQEFAGIVAEAKAGAAIAASAPPPAAEGGGEISPPNTGDAGLADSAAGSTALLLATALVAITLAGAGAFVRVRRYAFRTPSAYNGRSRNLDRPSLLTPFRRGANVCR
jgi:hypothetical protein